MLPSTAMAERRINPRERALKKAVIEFQGTAGAAAISCTVWNISKAGACLTVISEPVIPDYFDLVMSGARRPCRVMWRKSKQKGASTWLGVDFQLSCFSDGPAVMPDDQNNRPRLLQSAKGQVTLLIVAGFLVVLLSMVLNLL